MALTRQRPFGSRLTHDAHRQEGWIRVAGATGILHGLYHVLRYFTGPDPVGTVSLGPFSSFLIATPILMTAGIGTLLKRRVAALVLLTAAATLQVVTWIAAGRLTGLVPAALVIAIYYQGWSGVRHWHALLGGPGKSNRLASPPRPRPDDSGIADQLSPLDGDGRGRRANP